VSLSCPVCVCVLSDLSVCNYCSSLVFFSLLLDLIHIYQKRKSCRPTRPIFKGKERKKRMSAVCVCVCVCVCQPPCSQREARLYAMPLNHDRGSVYMCIRCVCVCDAFFTPVLSAHLGGISMHSHTQIYVCMGGYLRNPSPSSTLPPPPPRLLWSSCPFLHRHSRLCV
jgi:hypothetical protein